MKKFIIIIAIAIVGGCVMIFLLTHINAANKTPIVDNQPMPDLASIIMEVEYLGKAEYKDNPEYASMLLEPGSPFTWLELSDTAESLKSQEELFQFIGPADFDFENYVLLFSFGRSIRELECKFEYKYNRSYSITTTFENEHLGNSVLFYRIDKRFYVPAWLYGPCYILDGEEKTYIGNTPYNFNKPQKKPTD
jgi:hypothetical protein